MEQAVEAKILCAESAWVGASHCRLQISVAPYDPCAMRLCQLLVFAKPNIFVLHNEPRSALALHRLRSASETQRLYKPVVTYRAQKPCKSSERYFRAKLFVLSPLRRAAMAGIARGRLAEERKAWRKVSEPAPSAAGQRSHVSPQMPANSPRE